MFRDSFYIQITPEKTDGYTLITLHLILIHNSHRTQLLEVKIVGMKTDFVNDIRAERFTSINPVMVSPHIHPLSSNPTSSLSARITGSRVHTPQPLQAQLLLQVQLWAPPQEQFDPQSQPAIMDGLVGME